MPTEQQLKSLADAGYPELAIQKQWPPETAGHRMTAKVPLAHPDQTIGEAQTLVFHFIKVFTSVDYIYVVDRKGKLYGILTIKELYSNPKTAHIGNVCKRENLATVHPDAHQEKVVYLALKHNIKAVPVVDKERIFLGAILNDTILTILYKEAHEDLLRLAGVSAQAAGRGVLDTPVVTQFLHRFPWLLIGLLGGLFTATVIGFFENTLNENIILAAFIPLIVYMSDAVGTQMEACIIRDLAVERSLPFMRYFCRQLLITTVIAICGGVAVGGLITFLSHEARIGAVVGLSLCSATISSVFTGTLVPYAFSQLHCDPADGSGPIATILQDLLSVTIYFTMATLLL